MSINARISPCLCVCGKNFLHFIICHYVIVFASGQPPLLLLMGGVTHAEPIPRPLYKILMQHRLWFSCLTFTFLQRRQVPSRYSFFDLTFWPSTLPTRPSAPPPCSSDHSRTTSWLSLSLSTYLESARRSTHTTTRAPLLHLAGSKSSLNFSQSLSSSLIQSLSLNSSFIVPQQCIRNVTPRNVKEYLLWSFVFVCLSNSVM